MMTTRSPQLVLPAIDQATVVCLAGELDADICIQLGQELKQLLEQAARRGQRLVLDMAGVTSLGAAACRTLQLATGHLAHEPALVVAAPPAVRSVLESAHLAGVRLHDTLSDALASLPRPPAPQSSLGAWQLGDPSAEGESLREEVFGLRAKARTTGLIGVAQGILLERYDLSGPTAAFALLRRASQQFNVPLRVVASAVVTAPSPTSDSQWFPGRTTHAPRPDIAFLHAYSGDAADRGHVLAAALHEALALSGADAAEMHLTDPAQDGALFLEQHRGLGGAYWDQVALVTDPPVVCVRAQRQREPVTVPDVAADPDLAAHPTGRALLALGSHAVHSMPLITTDGHCTGTVTLHRAEPGFWLTSRQQQGLEALMADIATWRSWYRRTVVLDALEYLHQHRQPEPRRDDHA
ncbi:ANTAR domain-containing protein [Streptomyces sp. NPDC050534]|uniref:ANTAR domain-containing protein n=1 Tax=Streptomyces sp. NPDC050534 TaxID=3365625 RepID=UPI0037B49948